MASNVGPAVTSTCWPASTFGAKLATIRSCSCCGSSMRPSPISPQACSPWPTPITCAPSWEICARLRWVAGCAHISRFMAGATSNGLPAGRARQVRLTSSSARPCASRAMKSALQGASTITSASRPMRMCGMLSGLRASHWLRTTGRPESACMVTGVMNWQAASVIITCTVAPLLISSRHSSADL